VETVRTILANEGPAFELRIVDQSEDDATEKSLKPFLGDPRVHYRRSSTRGLAVATNLAICDAQNELIAVTDDDCFVPPDWLRELVAAFRVDRRIGMVFGNIWPVAHDRSAGFILSYVRDKPFLARRVGDKHRVEGNGSCMGLRRSVWRELGGLDEKLGIGAPLQSASDTDFAIRVLLAGYFIYETPRLQVSHQGFRTWAQSRPVVRRYMYGLGAMYGKHVKCGHWSILQVMFQLAWRWAFGQPAANLGHCPPKWMRLVSFGKGLLSGLRTPVDRATGHFV
jgi:GT2 family glycosyltransferase